MQHIRSHEELRVHQAAIEAAMRISEITKRFPPEERFSMVDKCGALRDQFVLTLVKRGESAAIPLILPAS